MANDEGLLKSEGRKQVYAICFNSLRDIHDQQLRAMWYEAEMIDRSFFKVSHR